MIEGISGKACNLVVSDWFKGGRLETWDLCLAQVNPLLQTLCIKVKSDGYNPMQHTMFQPPGLCSCP